MIINDINKFHNVLIKQSKFILIVRHAEKIIDENQNEDIFALLTRKGISDSKKFGNELLSLFNGTGLMKTSPIERCVQTANAILNYNFESKKKIEKSKILGDPGVFVMDAKTALGNFLNLGVKEVIERQLKNQILPGMRDLKNGLQMLFQEISNDLEVIKSFGIYITHDAIVIPLIKYLTGDFKYTENLIDYLNGIIVGKNENKEYFAIWNGKLFDIDKKINSLRFSH